MTIEKLGSGGGLAPFPFFGNAGDRLAVVVGKMVVDENYTTGGIAVDLSNFFAKVYTVFFAGHDLYNCVYDATTGKLLLYTASDTEETNATAVDEEFWFLAVGAHT